MTQIVSNISTAREATVSNAPSHYAAKDHLYASVCVCFNPIN